MRPKQSHKHKHSRFKATITLLTFNRSARPFRMSTGLYLQTVTVRSIGLTQVVQRFPSACAPLGHVSFRLEGS